VFACEVVMCTVVVHITVLSTCIVQFTRHHHGSDEVESEEGKHSGKFCSSNFYYLFMVCEMVPSNI